MKQLVARLRARRSQVSIGIVALAALASILGFILEPRRAAASYLTAYVTILGTVLGALLLLMIVELTARVWFTPLRMYAAAITSALPALALLFLPIAASAKVLFPWIAPDSLSPELRDAVAKKSAYLAPGVAGLRALLYWTVWLLVAGSLRAALVRRDRDRDSVSQRRVQILSVAGIVLVALTMTFASFDWLMSLSPGWSSSIYGLYFFAGAAAAAVALLSIIAGLALRRNSGTGMSADTLSALGNLQLTFLLLWIYFGYAQFLIIWIADIPREVAFYGIRARGSWGALGLFLFAGHFALPFLVLIVRALKRNATVMIALGAWILLLHYIDIYWLVMPEFNSGPGLHWLDLAAIATVGGVSALVVAARHPQHESRPSPVTVVVHS